MKKHIAILLVLLLMLGYAASALGDPKALDEYLDDQAAQLGANDFVVRTGKTDIDLLTDNAPAILKASGKKPIKFVLQGPGEANIEYTINAREATFYIPNGGDYADTVNLTKKGITARGVRIGSKESAFLDAYPTPYDSWTEDKSICYCFRVQDAPNALTKTEMANINEVRPAYFYELIVRVNAKTKKVTAILFSQWYIDCFI